MQIRLVYPRKGSVLFTTTWIGYRGQLKYEIQPCGMQKLTQTWNELPAKESKNGSPSSIEPKPIPSNYMNQIIQRVHSMEFTRVSLFQHATGAGADAVVHYV